MTEVSSKIPSAVAVTSGQFTFHSEEIRATALARAAARFGRHILRNPGFIGLVDRKLLRRLQSSIQSAASLGHRSSTVLWGPPESGKRSTLELLSQIFCVTVDRATNTVIRHPGNVSSTDGRNGVPVLGVVLDGAALRNDNDAAQAVLSAMYDFWFLAAESRCPPLTPQQQQVLQRKAREAGRAANNNSSSNNARRRGNNNNNSRNDDTNAVSTHATEEVAKLLGLPPPPQWAVEADELLSWLFQEALPESMHKLPPPCSAAAEEYNGGGGNDDGGRKKNQQTHFSEDGVGLVDPFADLSAAAAAGGASSSFRTAVQQTFRVFTHSGMTVMSALQHTLLELSKAGISPCFFIHDIRALGVNCDKVLYMISGLLHEQELQTAASAATTTTTGKNNNSKKSTSSASANLNGLASSGNAIVGGGMSIVMTSTNSDLRLEKRLSSRMNCDFLHCPPIKLTFIFYLEFCFRESPDERQSNQAAVALANNNDSNNGNNNSNSSGKEAQQTSRTAQRRVRDQQQEAQQSTRLPTFMQQVERVEQLFCAALADKSTAVHNEYAILSRRCEMLGRPAHAVRRLLECWFELANDYDFLREPVPIAKLEQYALNDVTPLKPLTAMSTERSQSAPREVVGLLACAISAALQGQQRRGGGGVFGHHHNHGFRTIQEHFTVFQELRTSVNDSIDAWVKAAVLLQRWGIISCTNAAVGSGVAASGFSGSAASSSAGAAGTANAAVAVMSTSRVELDIDNLDLLQVKLNEFCAVVYDQSTLQAVRALLR